MNKKRKVVSNQENVLTILDNIRKLRQQKRCSQEFIAEQIGISQAVYCKIENGQIDFKVSDLLALAKAFEMSELDFFMTIGLFQTSSKTTPKKLLKANINENHPNFLVG
jgi:transcriptional regulator with XRE-family HTH domain